MALKNIIISSVLLSFCTLGYGQVSDFKSELGDHYYYTDHFEIDIEAPAEEVWPQLVKMRTWLPWMANSSSDNPIVSEGERVNLYGEFYIEVVKVVPQDFVLLANLPAQQEGEQSHGIAMVTLSELSGSSVVSIFMSRANLWYGEAKSPLREKRESQEFSAGRQAMFKDNFLEKLKSLVEES
jgi:hypothetical protein